MANIIDIPILIEQLNEYTKLYDEGNPAISDEEWDRLYFKLQDLENKFGIYHKDSPTQKINYQLVSELEKSKHNHPMLSLAKTKDIKEVESFLGNKAGIAMLKMDGLTCSLTYEGGRLVKAETRGDGEVGEDITHNALVIKNIPNRIPLKNKVIIDGEVICTYQAFEQFKDEYKNPRNFASGSIRLLDSKECSKRNLSFVAWDVIEGINAELLSEKLNALIDYNFDIACYRLLSKETDYEAAIKDLKIAAEDSSYPIDGVVFKYNSVAEYYNAGKTGHHFKGGLAYKFADDEVETKLLDIEWTMGRTGVLTPVAIYEDIELEGTICNKASLHNISVMYETLNGGAYVGKKIRVFKANEIIPQICWAETSSPDGAKQIHIPDKCPICNGDTIVKDNDCVKVLYCDNPSCEGKLINVLDHFCGKKGLDIKGLSKARIEDLIEWGWVSNIKDIFELDKYRSEWINKSGYGVTSVDKFLKSIKDSSNTTLDKFICSLGIPLIGSTVSKEIARKIGTYDEFRQYIDDKFDFSEWEGFGDIMSQSLLKYDYTLADEIAKEYLTIELPKEENKNNNVKGKTFVITGRLKSGTRDQIKAKIEAAGGKVTGSVSGKTSYLVNNDVNSTTSKNATAKKLGVPIIDEDTLLTMLD